MRDTNKMQITKDLRNKMVTVTRDFDATPEEVWRAWTESKYLDQWWAPKPWRAETKEMDFREGGHWFYAMVGPDNTRHWCKVDFNNIVAKKSFESSDAFCDENGNLNNDLPTMYWKNKFQKTESGTRVIVEISFASESDLNKIIEMGFEEGFTSALGNLDHLFSAQLSRN